MKRSTLKSTSEYYSLVFSLHFNPPNSEELSLSYEMNIIYTIIKVTVLH